MESSNKCRISIFFNIPIYAMSRDDFVEFALKNNLQLAKTDMQGQNIFKFKPTAPLGVVVGNEGNGVSEQISSICKISLTIPMHKGIESLNAAVSGSIVMFEITSK